jgi:hypothetical protein
MTTGLPKTPFSARVSIGKFKNHFFFENFSNVSGVRVDVKNLPFSEAQIFSPLKNE